MVIGKLIDKVFRRARAAAPVEEFQPSAEEPERENPRLAQMFKEYTRSLAIEKMSAGQGDFAAEQYRRIIFNRSLFALSLRHADTAQAYLRMIQAADQLEAEPDKAISGLVDGAFRLVELLSQHAGRQFSPISAPEQIVFLCDQLREAGYLIINRKPTDRNASECDVICCECDCDSLESIVLSGETVEGFDQGNLLWRCAKHGAQSGIVSRAKQQTESPVPSASAKVAALSNEASALTDGKPTVSELLNLMHRADSLACDRSISARESFMLWRFSDAIKDNMDRFSATEQPESREYAQLRQERARQKEAFSPEFMTLMERLCERGSVADIERFGDFLFPNEHRERLSLILDVATDSERANYSRLFADWVRLKGYSPSEVNDRTDANVIQRLTAP